MKMWSILTHFPKSKLGTAFRERERVSTCKVKICRHVIETKGHYSYQTFSRADCDGFFAFSDPSLQVAHSLKGLFEAR